MCIKRKYESKVDIFTLLIIICFGIVALPLYIANIMPGLDPSWMYAINIFNDVGLKFGEDVILTYGPLGFLCGTLPIGNNLYIYTLFWGGVFFLYLYFLLNLFILDKDIKINRINMCITLILFTICTPLEAEYYISIVILLALSLAWFSNKKIRYFMSACMLTTAMLFIKFSGAILAISSIIIFVCIYFFKDRQMCGKLFKIVCAIPVFFIIIYLLYNPSIISLYKYVKSAIELSSGYNVAMSLNQNNFILILAIISAIAYCLFLISMFFINQEIASYMLIFCGAFFLAFKHGFVRADVHVYIFFSMFLRLLSIINLFIDWRQFTDIISSKKNLKKIVWISISSMILIPVLCLNKAPQEVLKVFTNNFKEITRGIENKIKNPIVGTNQLPQEILNIIGNKSVTIFPWEVSYDAYNEINYIPMPVFQAYNAYTPYLDSLNADFFDSEDKGPQYIILEMISIDGRFPLIEVPQTWSAIYRNYGAVVCTEQFALLQRVEQNITNKSMELSTHEQNREEWINIPQSDKLVEMRVDMELNIIGKLFKMFFRIPEVIMEMQYDTGEVVAGRVIVENFKEGVIINNIPRTIIGISSMLNQGQTATKVERIHFSGVGLKYYKKQQQITFLEEIEQKRTLDAAELLGRMAEEVASPIDGLNRIEQDTQYCVDSINGKGIVEKMEVQKSQGLYLKGWATDSQAGTVGNQVYVKIGEKFYTTTRANREDVAIHFAVAGYKECGVETFIKGENLENGVNPISLIIITQDQKEYYEQEINVTISVK